MNQIYKTFTSILITGLLLTGCNLLGGTNLNSQNAQQTAVANTVVALQTVLAANTLPTETPAVVPTQEIQPTFTANALPQPTAVVYTAPTPTSVPAFLVTNVQDITAVDNTEFTPGSTFTKTWRITNGGLAPWSSDTKLIFVSGDQMAAAPVALGHVVAPNQTVDVSVNLVAPASEGTYQGFFMLQASGGKNFGIGASAADAFWVKIIVKKFFQVTGATVNASPASYSGTCPGTVNLSATITSSAAGSVTYYFVTSTGNSSTYTMTFSAAGSNTSSTITWPVPGPDPLVVHVYIVSPNHQDFSPVTIPVTCS